MASSSITPIPQNGIANDQPLSKSQKKRLKQKAAKAAKRKALEEEEKVEEKVHSSSDANGISTLNPHEKLRHCLICQGYCQKEIDNALEEMWDLGMEYDDFNAVLGYLKSKKAQRDAELVAEAAGTKNLEPIENIDTSVAQEYNVAPKNEEPTNSLVAPVSTQSLIDDRPTFEEVSATSESADTALSPEESTAPPPPMDLASKLNVVANFENLHDAISALAEWASKAAKPTELMDLCLVTKGVSISALNTVIRRCIIDCQNEREFNGLLPSLKGLINGILRSCPNKTKKGDRKNVSEALIHSVTKARISMLESLKLGALTGSFFEGMDFGNLQDSIANSVAEFVTSAMSSALTKNMSQDVEDENDQMGLYAASEDDLNLENVGRIEAEITSLLAQIPTRGNGVVELMTRRDLQKIAAEKSSSVTKLLINVASGNKKSNGHVENTLSATAISNNGNKFRLSTEQGKEDLISSILGDTMSTIQDTRASYKSTVSQLLKLQSEHSSMHADIVTDLQSCETELERIEIRKEEIRKETEKLELENDRLLTRKADIDAELAKLVTSPSSNFGYLQDKQKNLSLVVRLDDAVKIVVRELEKFESRLTTLSLPVETETVAPLQYDLEAKRIETLLFIDGKIASYVIQMRNYFFAEADIIDFLRGRISAMQVDQKGLQHEVAECTALGMRANVSQMTQSLEEIEKNISDDGAVVAALSAEAEHMRDNLIQHAEHYVALGKELTRNDYSTLREIGVQLSRIGIDCSNFVLLMPQSVAFPPHNFKQQTQPQSIAEQISFDPPSTSVNKATSVLPQQPTAAPVVLPWPKLSWAMPKQAEKKVEIKSLRDIQNEEMSAKAL